ncbi:MAG: WD40 repeat domain-containing protein [Chloroflexaceae bacterium]
MQRRSLLTGIAVVGVVALAALCFLVGGTMFWGIGEVQPAHVWEFPEVRSAAFLPDGRLAVAADKLVTIYSFPDKRALQSIPDHGYLAVSPDGATLAIGSQGTVRLYASEAGFLRGTLTCWPTESSIAEMGITFSPDGRVLAVTEQRFPNGSEVQLWDVATQQRIGVIRVDDPDATVAGPLAFSPNGRYLAVATVPRGVWVINVERQEVIQALQRGPSQSLAFSPDGALLSVGGATIRTYATDTWRLVYEQIFKEPRAISVPDPDRDLIRYRGMVVAISPDGRWLATPDRYPPGDSLTFSGKPTRHPIALRDLATGKRKRVLSGSPIQLHELMFSPDGRWLVDSSLSRVWIWPVEG